MTTENTINKTISALYAGGTETRDELILGVYQKHHADIGLNKATKLVANWMKAEGIAVPRSKGITESMDNWLLDAPLDEPRTAAQLKKWIAENGTENTMRHLTAYEARARLVAAAFKKGLESK